MQRVPGGCGPSPTLPAGGAGCPAVMERRRNPGYTGPKPIAETRFGRTA
jgi:hypothetical protein